MERALSKIIPFISPSEQTELDNLNKQRNNPPITSHLESATHLIRQFVDALKMIECDDHSYELYIPAVLVEELGLRDLIIQGEYWLHQYEPQHPGHEAQPTHDH